MSVTKTELKSKKMIPSEKVIGSTSFPLAAYELFRRAHMEIKLLLPYHEEVSRELANAMDAVDSVLYMAEQIACGEEFER